MGVLGGWAFSYERDTPGGCLRPGSNPQTRGGLRVQSLGLVLRAEGLGCRCRVGWLRGKGELRRETLNLNLKQKKINP